MDLPAYFVFDEDRAYTTNAKPKKAHFQTQIKIKGYKTPLTLASLRPLGSPHAFNIHPSPTNLSAYKSNLQKCVRRRLTGKAVYTTYAMMAIGPLDLLRRLTIIMVEDALPLPSFATLTWWMMAVAKGYELTDEDVSAILGIIYAICKFVKFREVTSKSDEMSISKTEWNNLPRDQQDLLWSLEFRASYGGMRGDVMMLKKLQGRWFSRFSDESGLWEQLKSIDVPLVDLYVIQKTILDQSNRTIIIPEAIDQHCFKWIPKKIHQRYPEYSETDISGAIWFYRSRINRRKLIEGSGIPGEAPLLKRAYLEIEETLEGLCRWIIDKVME